MGRRRRRRRRRCRPLNDNLELANEHIARSESVVQQLTLSFADLSLDIVCHVALECEFDYTMASARLQELRVPSAPITCSPNALIDDVKDAGQTVDFCPDVTVTAHDQKSHVASLQPLSPSVRNQSNSLDQTLDKLRAMFPEVESCQVESVFGMLGSAYDTVQFFLSSASHDSSRSLHETYPVEVLMISRMFPILELDVILDIFVENDSDLDSTIDCLLPEVSTVASNQSNSGKVCLADRLKVIELRRSFPSADAELILSILSSHSHRYNATVSALQEIFPEDIYRVSPIEDVEPLRRTPDHTSSTRVFWYQDAQDMLDRLYKGIALSPLDLSADSEQHWASRNLLAHRARQAFNAGNTFNASILASQAQDEARKAKHQREVTVVRIIAKHNRQLHLLQRIDLHELRVGETKNILKDCIHRIKLTYPRQRRMLSIIIGIGRHSATTFEPKLYPAVIALLKMLQIEYKDLKQGEITAYIT